MSHLNRPCTVAMVTAKGLGRMKRNGETMDKSVEPL